MDHSETVNELNNLALKTHYMSRLAMITVYLLDDLNYSCEDAARDLVGIINDLDAVSACITLESADEGAINQAKSEVAVANE